MGFAELAVVLVIGRAVEDSVSVGLEVVDSVG